MQRRALRLLPPSCAAAACCVVAHYSSSSDVRAAYVRSKHNSSSHYCSVRHTSSHGVAATTTTTTTATASGAGTATRPSVMSSAARTHATDGAATADDVTRNGDAALSDSGDGDDEAAVYALYNDHVDIATDNDAAAVTENDVDNVDDDDDDDIDDDGVAMSTQASAHDKDALYRHDVRHDAVHAHTTAATAAAVDAVQDDASASLPSSILQAQYRHAMGTMLVYLYNAYDAEHLSVATLSPVKQQMLYDARAAMQRRLQRHRHRQTAQHAHDSSSSNNDGNNAHAAVTTTATGATNNDDDYTVATASVDDDDDSSDSNRAHAEATAAMPAMFLADVLVYLRHEVALEQVLSQRSIRGRARARLWLRVLSPLRLSALERQYVLRRVCSVVERRAVSLVSATRLLRRRWPSTLRGDSGCAMHYHYLLRSLLAWLSDALQLHSSSSSSSSTQQQPQHDDSAATTTRDDNNTAAAAVRAVCALSPRDARGVLENCAATLRSQSGNAAVSALTRCLVARATADVYTRAAHTHATTAAAAVTAAASPPTHAPLHPSALISLLWGIHTSGAHVPVCVWCDVVQQLIAMDGTLRGTVSDVATSTHLLYNNNNNSSSSSSSSSRHRGVVGDGDTDVTHAHTTTTTTQATADDGNDDDKAAATSTMTYRDALRLRRASVGHVFSGLTTRQIYRLLAVLRDAGLLTTTHVDGARDTPSLSPSPQEQQQQHSAAWLRLDGASDDDDGDGRRVTGARNNSSDTYASATTTTASSTRRPAVWALPATTMVALHALADSALKNVVFETAAGGGNDATTTTARLTRRAVLRRTQRVADLTPHELLDLLTLAAQLRVPFSVSAQRVAEQLLTPMIDQLRDEQALTFLQATRRTHCATPSLLRAFAQMLQRRGRHAPRALPLAKALLRTLLQQQPQLLLLQPSPLLLYRTDVVDGNNNNDNDTMTGRLYDDDDDVRDAQQTAQQRRALATAADDNDGGGAATDVIERFVDDFLQLCAESICRVHATELIVLCELLYGLARRLAPDTATAQRVRALVDAACAQMERLLQLGVVHVGVASRLLEYTVMLGMRRELARYDGVARLLRTRAVAIAHTAAQREQRGRPHSDRSSRDDDDNAAVAKATTCDNTRHAATVVASTPTASDAHAAVTHDNNDDDDHAQTTTATTAAAACATCARSDADDDTASMSPHALRLRRACEAQLPTLSRATLGVYGELLFMYERMAVMQARVHDSERRRFTHALERVGLYALLHGAALLRDGHLHTPPPLLTQQQQQQQQRYSSSIDDHATTAHATTSSPPPPPPLPLWLEKRVSAVVQTKLTRAALTSQSSNDAVLRVLGHVHCDVHKVRQLLQMLEHTPLLLLRRRRAVLLYAQELARRFAGAPEQAHVAKLLQHALY